MTPTELAAIAILCTSPFHDDEAMRTTILFKLPVLCIDALKSSPPRVETAPAVPMRVVKRKSRLAQLNPTVPGWVLRRKHECGGETPDWYQKNSTWRYKCR